MTTLQEFTQSLIPKVNCRVCDLPKDILDQVNLGAIGGLTFVVIAKWLRSEGYDWANADRVRSHFRREHAPLITMDRA